MNNRKILRGVLIVAAVCLIAAGVMNGDYIHVLQKAVRICYECIGLG